MHERTGHSDPCLSGNFTFHIQRVTVYAMEIVPSLDDRIRCLVISWVLRKHTAFLRQCHQSQVTINWRPPSASVLQRHLQKSRSDARTKSERVGTLGESGHVNGH